MGFIQIGNTHYYYEQAGSGPPLMLIAGYSCDHTFWDDLTKDLTKHFQLIVFDNRGVGQTRDNGSTLTLESMADDTILLIQALGLSRLSILGQSMGGLISQIILDKAPNLIQNLILLNSAKSVNFRSLLALETFIKLLNENAPIETVLEASFPWFYSSPYLAMPHQIKRLKEKIISNPHPQTLFDLQRQFHALKQYQPRYEKNTAISTLVVAAQDDIICPQADSEKIKEHLPHAKFANISGGHSSPIENPNEVVRVIQDFLL